MTMVSVTWQSVFYHFIFVVIFGSHVVTAMMMPGRSGSGTVKLRQRPEPTVIDVDSDDETILSCASSASSAPPGELKVADPSVVNIPIHKFAKNPEESGQPCAADDAAATCDCSIPLALKSKWNPLVSTVRDWSDSVSAAVQEKGEKLVTLHGFLSTEFGKARNFLVSLKNSISTQRSQEAEKEALNTPISGKELNLKRAPSRKLSQQATSKKDLTRNGEQVTRLPASKHLKEEVLQIFAPLTRCYNGVRLTRRFRRSFKLVPRIQSE